MKNWRSGFSNLFILVFLAGLAMAIIVVFNSPRLRGTGSASSPLPTAVDSQASPLPTPVGGDVPLARIGPSVLLQASGPLGRINQTPDHLVNVAGENGTTSFDLASGSKQNLANFGLSNAYVSDHWLTYEDHPPLDSAIYYHRIKVVDLNTGKEVVLGDQTANQQRPQISGNFVVWIDWRNREKSGVDIYGYDLTTDKEFPVVINSRPNRGPKISGHWIVYVEPTDLGKSLAEMRVHSLETGEDFAIGIIPSPNDASNGTYYAIDGDKVVWTKYLTDGQCELHLYDLTTQTDQRLLDLGGIPASDLSISAKSGLVVFPGGTRGWVILDWLQPTPTALSFTPPVKSEWGYQLSVAGDYLVWQIPLSPDYKDGQLFITKVVR
jgi:beta propeller repeat protein